MDKIIEGKSYQTKAGNRVTHYAFHTSGDYPIHGAVQSKDTKQWKITAWDVYGKSVHYNDWNLIPVPEKFVRKRWVNVFADGTETIHDCKWNADNYMKGCREKRIACVCVKVEGTAGDGLED